MKTRKKRSPIWKIPREDLEIVRDCLTFSELFRRLKMNSKGNGSFAILQRRLVAENIDFSHIQKGRDSNRGRKFLSINFDPTKMSTMESQQKVNMK